ncbi:hypothetical protein H6G91_35275 [Nostoc muscorum FACHB-395]|nr:hypothetical protein [Desmonostoc muscorum FACHB-395]
MAVELTTVKGNCGVALNNAAVFDAGIALQGNWRSLGRGRSAVAAQSKASPDGCSS